ncbi:MAG TPA: Lrp/AsnC family transcriptional regulator [Candidatus Baltobacteraceae bacterium]|nr:Lrp/AsnC family transcriptional regulator [Candidatus Baltobacteraceae bacterium]
MVELPERVRATLEVLKKEYGSYLEIKFLNRRYSVFEATSRYDPEMGRSRKITRYLGWITGEGTMIPARHRQPKLQDVARAIAREEAAQKMNLQELWETIGKEREAANRYENTILMNLSMNGRISHKTIAQRIGLKPTAAEYQIRKVEQKYGIKYIAEMDVDKLGYLEFIILIKFKDKKPATIEIKEVLNNQPSVQFCATLKGDYDLMLYALTEKDFRIANENLDKLRSTVFANYPASWHVKLAYTRYGFIPMRERFFDLLEKRVWHRTKESPRPNPGDILHRDFVVLKELNSNGARQFTNIDIKYGFPRGRSQYTYYKLLEAGTIRRITMDIDNSSVKQDAVIFMERIDISTFERTRSDFRKDLIGYTKHPINKYVAAIDVWDPDGAVMITPLYKGDSVENRVEELTATVNGAKFTSALISEIIIGGLCYRRFDNNHSLQYESLVKNKVLEFEQPKQYR